MQFIHSAGGGVASPSFRPFIAIPIGERLALHSAIVVSLWNLQKMLINRNIDADLAILHGNTHVDDGRNELVRRFLHTECDQLLFWDSDVIPRAAEVVKLLEYEDDLVGGVYPLKQDPISFPVSFSSDELEYNEDGLLRVEGLPTGMLKIRREVLEKMHAECEEKFRGKIDKEIPNLPEVAVLFKRDTIGGARVGGDIRFTYEAEKAGFTPYADMDMNLKHIGEQLYTGVAHDFLKVEKGLHQQEFEDAVQALRKGVPRDVDFQRLVKWYGNANYAASWELLQDAYNMAMGLGATHILECGSGLSTLVLSLANPLATIVVLEDHSYYAQKTAEFLERYGNENVLLACAPLKNGWYQVPEQAPRDKYSLVLVDGPDRSVSDRAQIFRHFDFKIGTRFIIDDIEHEKEKFSKHVGLKVKGKYATGRKL